MSATDDLARVIMGAPDADSTDPTCQLRYGVVTQASPLLVKVGAATVGQPCSYMSGYIPKVGDYVSVLVRGADRVALGAIGAAQARWELTHSTTQSVASSASYDLIWDTETADPSGMHAASAATVVAPVDGVYQCSYSVRFAASGTGVRVAWLECSRSSTRYGYQEIAANASTLAMSGAAPIFALAGQTIKVVVFHSAVGALNYTDTGAIYNNFCGALVH